ncbi:MAG: ATP-binding protein [Deltaproteobacteria bacterium]|nr:ATP-binding protein [Deltaproteobacteria bacterium]
MLRFLDRTRERARLERAIDQRALAVVWGRRRVGKSRLVRTSIEGRPSIYYVGDERDAALQREALAREAARLIPGFDEARYDGWESLLLRLWRDVPEGAVVAIDELPFLVSSSPELPSLLQKLIDRGSSPALILCGSSQAMMHGLVLEASAPLYGRAQELLRVGPLGARWLSEALGVEDPRAVVERWTVAGGVPRYWELLEPYRSLSRAIQELLLDPLGPLFMEPAHVLKDDYRDPRRAMSILALVGSGTHRLSEIAGRLGEPSSSLARPVARLVELGLVCREVPFGQSARDSKRAQYRVADPLLSFWYRFVEPNRSRIEAGLTETVWAQVSEAWPAHVGLAWEALVRQAVPRMTIAGRRFEPASRRWGKAGAPELDVVAAAVDDPRVILVGEVKRTVKAREVPRELASLRERSSRVPELAGAELRFALFALEGSRDPGVIGAKEVIDALD